MTGRISLVGVQPPELPTDPMGPQLAAVPISGPVPGPPVPVSGMPVPPVTGKQPTRRLRLWLAMATGILALLCVGAVGVLVSLYDGATKIDRSAPDTVTDSFLIAYLVNRDDAQAQLFSCKAPNFAEIAALRDEIVKREKDFGVRVSVSWGALVRAQAGKDREQVGVDLTITGSTNAQVNSSHDESWTFLVVSDDGSWRVCGASKVA